MRKFNFASKVFLLASFGAFASSKLYNYQNCDYSCNNLCFLSDDMNCPEQCGCPPYQFKDRVLTQCQKYCHLFAETDDCAKWCEDPAKLETLNFKGLSSQNQQEAGQTQQKQPEKQEQNIEETITQLNEAIKQYFTSSDATQIQNIHNKLSEIAKIPNSNENSNVFDFKCVVTCTEQPSLTVLSLQQCLKSGCLRAGELFTQLQHEQEMKQKTSSEVFYEFIMNTVVALLISGISIFAIGYFGLKLFNKLNKREFELSDNLLQQNYVRMTDGENNYYKQQNYNYNYKPPQGLESVSMTVGPGERTNSYNSQSSLGQFSPQTYSTPDPNQIQALNRQIREAKSQQQQYQSLNKSSNRLCLSGSYNRIDEHEDEYSYGNEQFDSKKFD